MPNLGPGFRCLGTPPNGTQGAPEGPACRRRGFRFLSVVRAARLMLARSELARLDLNRQPSSRMFIAW